MRGSKGEAVGVRVLESMYIMGCGGQCLPFRQWPGQEKEWGFIPTGLWEKSEPRELPFLLWGWGVEEGGAPGRPQWLGGVRPPGSWTQALQACFVLPKPTPSSPPRPCHRASHWPLQTHSPPSGRELESVINSSNL